MAGTKPAITAFSVDSGVQGDRLTNDRTLTLIGIAEPNLTLRILVDGILLGTVMAGEDGNWSFTTLELSDGGYSFTAETGEDGERQSSDPLEISIDSDTPAPEFTSIEPADNSLQLSGTAEAGASVDIYRDGTLIGTATATSSGLWGYLDTGYGGGSTSYSARATDAAGNTAETADAVTYSPNQEPVLASDQSADGAEPAQMATSVTASSPTPTTFEARIAAAGDDIEQRESGGISSNVSDLELGYDGSTPHIVGLRFTSIDIPPGAIITSAYIQFTTDEVSSGLAALRIEGEDTDNAGDFTTIKFNVSSRIRTDASVSWDVDAWTTRGEAGAAQRTPDLAAIIQEIVDRDGWAALNDIVLLITGTGTRTAKSFEGSAAAAPLLHIQYYVPPASDPVAFNNPADADSATNQIAELAPEGTKVGITASARDPDAGDAVTYSIDDARFVIDATTGVITRSGIGIVDFETETSITLAVTATSSDRSTATQTYTLNVLNSPEPVTFNTPADADPDNNSVSQDAAAGSKIGITASATDPDAGSAITYSVNDSRFAIDANGVITRSATGTLNAQSEPSITLTVTARSSDQSVANYSFDVNVTAGASNQPPTSLTLVKTTLTSQWSPASPDPSGIAYISHLGRLFVSDGEVNEMSIFTGKNAFEMTLGGQLVGSFSTTSFSDEPTGVAYNPFNRHLFFTDDTGTRSVYELNPGSDGLYNTSDDVVTSFKTSAFGSKDPEGITYDTKRGVLYIADGVGDTIYTVNPGANGRFDGVSSVGGDDIVSSFSVASLGINDPEGVEYDPAHDLLYVIASRTKVAMVTPTGELLGTLDISAAGARSPAGLALAPSSGDANKMSLYIVDRGVDNDSNPNENDGKVYEFLIDNWLLA
ncbi:Ig-like domain-containing protein [Sinorhizobium alkalisoli]|uniref:RTX toxin n=1 Tax=Sinorhizobium alkalisoli TaxID=1752398 RepID=A0A1E3V7H9_9HYPH|nr:Ig-like domain-containing protein [Sinorhizobium alkalisoli]ODR89568.1 RTX toxin [Sinorhizobium alkalisoli]